MTDLDRLLRESLKETGSSYSPPDPNMAREEFVARRRRRNGWRLSGGVALAGTALVAALFFASAEPLTTDDGAPGPMKPAALSILTRFEVGTEPLSIAAGGDRRLWIASRAGGAVSRIDLDTGRVETIDLPGANEIVVDDRNVWVSGESGNYLRINESDPSRVFDGNVVEEEGSQLVDLAVGGHPRGAAWAVDMEGCIWELTTPAGGCNTDENVATDVAADGDETWILASEQGYAWFFDGDPASQGGRPGQNHSDLPTSEYGDLTMTENTIWVSGGGRIATVDLETGQRRELEIDGDYADLALGPETVWALAGWADGDERGRVYELSHDLEVIGISDVLRGEPSDLVADANGVWITIRHRNEVMYLSRGETAPPVAPLEAEEPADG